MSINNGKLKKKICTACHFEHNLLLY